MTALYRFVESSQRGRLSRSESTIACTPGGPLASVASGAAPLRPAILGDHPTLSQTHPARDLSLDNLRTIAVLLVLPFHALGLWSYLPWMLHEPDLSPTAHRVFVGLHLWHMPLLFLLAGAGAAAALRKRSTRQFLGERLLRLGVPLLFGSIVLVPPMVFIERISVDVANRWSPIDFDGSYLKFYRKFFRCCYPEHNLSHHHLWFVAYLLVFSFMLWPVWRWLAGPGGTRLAERLLPRPGSAWRLLLLGLPLVATELLLSPFSWTSFRFAGDWDRIGGFLIVLALGGWIFTQPKLLAATERVAWTALALAVATTFLWFAMDYGSGWRVGNEWPNGDWADQIVSALAQWFWLLGLLGVARLTLNRQIPLITDFAPLAIVFYVLHFTVLLGLAYWLKDWQAGIAMKLPALILISGAATWLLSLLVARTPVLRFLVGLRSKSPSSAASG
jgi:surface polysaccharide O-acyltransferase-like enzyme